MNIYLDLFLTFAKVGVCTFGGGYAMLPILQREVVEKKSSSFEARPRVLVASVFCLTRSTY